MMVSHLISSAFSTIINNAQHHHLHSLTPFVGRAIFGLDKQMGLEKKDDNGKWADRRGGRVQRCQIPNVIVYVVI
jgi:hypothetical protein